jgi:hypothetical protein
MLSCEFAELCYACEPFLVWLLICPTSCVMLVDNQVAASRHFGSVEDATYVAAIIGYEPQVV